MSSPVRNAIDIDPDLPRSASERQRQTRERQPDDSSSSMRLLLRPKTLLTLLKTAYSEWSTHNVPRMSAALAYYTIFSLAPVLIIAIAIAGMAFGEKAAQGAVIAEIQDFIGQTAREPFRP
jgi:uncharacterized BrkB/YihY/UPF0761 family membrane protein